MPDDVRYYADRNAYYFVCRKCGSVTIYPATRILGAVNGWCFECLSWRDGPRNSLLWERKNGSVISIADMETSHIQKCIGMIMHRANWRKPYMEPLLLELKRRLENEGVATADR